MRTWPRVALATLGYWAVWTGVAGLAMTIHGDCGVAATDMEIAGCVRDKGRVGIAALAVGAIGYALMLWLMIKGRRRRR